MTFVEFLNIIHTHRAQVLVGVAFAALAVALFLSRRQNKKLRTQNKAHAEQASAQSGKHAQANLLGEFAVFFRSVAANLQLGPQALNEAKALKLVIEKMMTLVQQLGFDQPFFDRLAEDVAAAQKAGLPQHMLPGIAALKDGFLRDTKAQLEGVIKLLSSEQRVAKPSAEPTSMFALAGASPTQPQDADVSFDNLLIVEAIPDEQAIEAAPTSSKRGGKIVKVDDDLDNAETTVFKVEEDKELPTATANQRPPSVPPVPGQHNGLVNKSSRLKEEGRMYRVIGNNTVDTEPGTPQAKLRSSAPPPNGQPVARVSSPPPLPRAVGPVPPPAPPPLRGKTGSGTRTAVQVPRVPTQVGVGNRVG